jgi:cytochrome b6-f complex iron-sulfur subunit
MTKLSRREFLKFFNRLMAAFGLTALGVPIIAYFYPPKLEEVPSEPVQVGNTGDLPLGQSVTVRFGRYPAIIINTAEGLKAYSAVCTHFACIVKWDPDSGQIACPCHAGFFDPVDGSVISGPPPSPLESLPIEIVDNVIYVGGSA